MSHQFLDPTSHGLHMVDDQLVQIRVTVFGVNNELIADRLTSGIGIRLSDI
jgi:hypothetical protein